MARKRKQEVEESDSEEEFDSEEEAKKKKSKASTRSSSRKTAVKKEDVKKEKEEVKKEDSDKEEEEKEDDKSHDHLMKQVGSVHRTRGEGTYVTFGRNKAQLRNIVQNICQNYSRDGRTPPAKVSLEDLFYARNILANLLVKEEKVPDEESDEEAESVETRFRDSQKVMLQNQRNQYLGGAIATPPGLEELVEWIDKETADRVTEAKKILDKGLVSFDGLSLLFKPGTKITGRSYDTGAALIGYQVVQCQYNSVQTLTGKVRWFSMSMEFVVSVGSSFLILNHSDSIDYFPTSIKPDLLDYNVMSPTLENMLTERGKRYVKLSTKPHYMSYDSECFSIHRQKPNVGNGNFGYHQQQQMQGLSTASTFLRTRGRVMVDTDTGRRLGHFAAERGYPGLSIIQMTQNHHQQKLQQQQQQNLYGHNPFGYNNHRARGNQQGNNELQEVPESMLSLCWPALTGFSFTAKIWGHVLVDGIKEIEFDDKAFEQLVLAPDRKQLIHAIVKHSEVVFTDIISGKGGGSIFLLHGPPGVGKTLTAEAVAEMLHKPMYSVSMGELGTTPTELETNLKDILDLANVWGAIVLMDEADIFLERRGQKEIIRNAMVGVIMRLIEYYQGVLFLTSNRVDSFDEAFYSRITVALKYEPLTMEVRESVWITLAKAANIKHIDAKKLSHHPLNGRQIKNCILLSQGLAKADSTEVNMDHIERTVRVCLEFVSEMEAKNLQTQSKEHIATGYEAMTLN